MAVMQSHRREPFNRGRGVTKRIEERFATIFTRFSVGSKHNPIQFVGTFILLMNELKNRIKISSTILWSGQTREWD